MIEVVVGMVLVLLCGLVGGLIGYNLGAKQKPDGPSVPVLCRTLEKLVDVTADQSRRSLDMVALDQSHQMDRISAEYLPQAVARAQPSAVPSLGYIEEPPAPDDLPEEIPGTPLV